MAEMTPFDCGWFYDVPRCISLRYRGRRFLLQSAFDENLDEYPGEYSVYIVPESADDSRPVCLLSSSAIRQWLALDRFQ